MNNGVMAKAVILKDGREFDCVEVYPSTVLPGFFTIRTKDNRRGFFNADTIAEIISGPRGLYPSYWDNQGGNET